MQAREQHTSNFWSKNKKLSPNVIMKSNGLKGEKSIKAKDPLLFN
jgi:hypothetical protein